MHFLLQNRRFPNFNHPIEDQSLYNINYGRAHDNQFTHPASDFTKRALFKQHIAMFIETQAYVSRKTCGQVGKIFVDYSVEYSTIIHLNIRRIFFRLLRTIEETLTSVKDYASTLLKQMIWHKFINLLIPLI